MADQFVVPQFLDVEAKIIGPITMRQFVIMIMAALLDFLAFRLIPNIFIFIVVALIVTGLAAVFAFARVNGQPFHIMFLNMVQTIRKPLIRIWDKTRSDADIKVMMKKDEEEVPEPLPVKASLHSSRLNDITLILNTGGTYNPEAHE
jgi:hypothetical protein